MESAIFACIVFDFISGLWYSEYMELFIEIVFWMSFGYVILWWLARDKKGNYIEPNRDEAFDWIDSE